MKPAHRLSTADPAPAVVRLLEGAALACILAVLVARPFLSEMPFRSREMVFLRGTAAELRGPPEELIRLTLNMILLGAVSLWALAQAARRQFRVAAPALGIMILLFAALSFGSTLSAVDRRGALTGWLEQVALLLGCFVTIQLARRECRWGLVIVVLAALGLTMAAKSIGQVTWEVPQTIADFEANRAQILLQRGIEPDSPSARMFEKRLYDPSATGYFGLSNVFGSLLILLAAAAAGLAIDKLARALPGGQALAMLKRGQVHLPTLAAIVAVLLAVGPIAALALTRGKGAIAASALAGAVGVVIMARPAFFAGHRRKLLIAGAAALLAGLLAMWAYGSYRGGLPGRSMQVRWEYWVGAGRIIRDSPLRGVGAGNFGDAYLKHRLPGAAEATKTAHNVLLDAACAFGLPAAAVHVAALVWVFVALTRPAPTEAAEPDRPPTVQAMVGWCIFLPLVVFASRVLWDQPAEALLIPASGLLPAMVAGLALLAMTWAGESLGAASLCGRYARIALGAGLAGFLVHNLISFSLFSPATATVFWIAAAAAAAPALRPRELPGAKGLSIAAAVLALTGTAAAWVWMWRPVQRKSWYLGSAHAAYAQGLDVRAQADLKEAIAADELDAIPASHLARIYLSAAPSVPPNMQHDYAVAVIGLAELAYQRSHNTAYAIRLARALQLEAEHRTRALQMASAAVQMDPMSARLRWEYARMLYEAGKLQAAAGQVRRVREIDSALPPNSDLRLTEEEKKSLAGMAEMIEAGRKRQANPTQPRREGVRSAPSP